MASAMEQFAYEQKKLFLKEFITIARTVLFFFFSYVTCAVEILVRFFLMTVQ